MQFLNTKRRAAKGASLLEYGLIVGLVSVVAIGSVLATGNEVKDVFCSSGSSLASARGAAPDDCSVEIADGGAGGGAGGGTEGGGETGGGTGEGGTPSDPLDDGWDFSAEAPDDMVFTANYGAEPLEALVSNGVTISGITQPVAAKSYNGATFSVNGGAYQTEATVTQGDVVRLAGVAHETRGAEVRYTFRAGGSQATWKVTTNLGDTAPDAIAFTDVTDVAPNAVVFSEAFRVSGIQSAIRSSAPSGATWQRYDPSINFWRNLSSSNDIFEGDLLRLQGTASNALNTTRAFNVSLSTTTTTWSITTQAALDTPVFDFVDQLDMETSGRFFSNEIVVSGLSTPAVMSFTNVASIDRYYVNGKVGTVHTAVRHWVENGDRIKVSGSFSDTSFAQQRSVIVNIGGTSDSFTASYTDGLKDVSVVALDDLQDVTLVQQVVETRTVSGFDGIARVRLVTTGTNFEIQINGVAMGSFATIRAGDELRFRMTAPPSPSTARTLTAEIGDQTVNWTVETVPHIIGTISNLTDVSGVAGGSYTIIPFDTSGANYAYYIAATSSWGQRIYVERFIGAGPTSTVGSDQSVFFPNDTRGSLRVNAPPAGTTGTITITIRDKNSIGASTIVDTMTIQVTSTP